MQFVILLGLLSLNFSYLYIEDMAEAGDITNHQQLMTVVGINCQCDSSSQLPRK